jgi:2-oxoglutarate dehydrogenase E1 component
LERFLQLCAQDNMQVCNLTTPAQYFHVLRRQIHRGYRKPLVIMTPKSLLRAEDASSRVEDFTNARFEEILDDPSVKDAKKINRVILCSGKVYYDLLKARAEDKARASAAIVRIEQLYPLNDSSLKAIFKRYPGAKDIVWCQEEPKNNGAWTFIAPLIAEVSGKIPTYAGRPESASPAAGSSGKHKEQQASLLNQAFIA